MKYCPNQECPHFERTGDFSEYNDSITTCADCGTALQSEKPIYEREYYESDFMGNPIEFSAEEFDSPLVVIETFTDTSLAYIAKAQIETAGIPAVMKDDGVVSMDWMLSNAVGGVKLLVPTSRAKEAYNLLHNDSELIQEESKQLSQAIEKCPACGSTEYTNSKFKTRIRALSMLLALPFTFGKNTYICKRCQHNW